MSQVKRDSISSIMKFEYKLPQELPNNLVINILGNYEVLEKLQSWLMVEPSLQAPFQK